MRALNYIEINREALLHNLKALKSLGPSAKKTVAVVKANAYGHGLEQVVKTLDGYVDYFAVDDLEELVAVRKLSKCPVLILGYVGREQIEQAVSLGAELVIYDRERLDWLQRAGDHQGKRPRVHVKIDALLGRQGILPSEVPDFLETLRRYPGIDLVAAYSHFANIEDTTDLTHAHSQTTAFDQAFAMIREMGWPDVERHESASSGAMVVEGVDSANSWVRFGISLYGLYPSTSLERTSESLQLRPVLKWVSHLAQVKDLPARHPVGYGLTFITSRVTKIGIVPQGYSDGYDRGLSNTGEVLVRGKRCAVLGRIAMNMFAVDLSLVPDAQPEDEVVLLGQQGGDGISAEEIALKTGTINYEVVARISPLIPRVYL